MQSTVSLIFTDENADAITAARRVVWGDLEES